MEEFNLVFSDSSYVQVEASTPQELAKHIQENLDSFDVTLQKVEHIEVYKYSEKEKREIMREVIYTRQYFGDI